MTQPFTSQQIADTAAWMQQYGTVTPPIPPIPPEPPTDSLAVDIHYGMYTLPDLLTKAGPGNVVSPSQLSIDDAVGWGSLPTLRGLYSAGSALHGPEIEWYTPTPIQSCWIRQLRRCTPGFTTSGLGTGAAGWKIMGWGWSGADNRGTLDVTNGNQIQLSMGANVGSTWTIPFVNSADAGQGHQLATVGSWWTDGHFYWSVIQLLYSAHSITAKAWLYPDGTMPTSPILTIFAPTNGITSTPPSVNRGQAMGYLNMTPMAKSQAFNDAVFQVSTAPNPWGLA